MRLFVAIEFEDRVRGVLRDVQQGLGAGCDGVRWIPPAQLHLTVKFLGEVPDGDVPGVAQAVTEAARAVGPFSLKVADCGCFPPRGLVRIVWVGLEEASGALLNCVEELEQGLERLGFPRERRRFSPHVTIGRVREDRSGGRIRSVTEAFSFDPLEQPVGSITLMSSVLSPKGPTYTPVNKVNLG